MEDGTKLINWDPQWELGFETIDVQHKHFVSLLNTLYSSFQNHKSKAEVMPIIEELVNYAKLHFGTEEQYMMASNFPGYENHKAIHIDLQNKLLELIEKYKNGDQQQLMDIVDFLENWLIEHLITEDSLYKDHFKRANIK